MSVSKTGRKSRAKAPATPAERAEAARRAANTRALGALRLHVPDEAERRLYTDTRARYADACAMAERLRAEWEALGCPVTDTGSMRQTISHPLVKAIADADSLAAKFAQALGIDLAAKLRKRGPGRPVGSVSAPDRTAGAPPRIVRVK